MIRRIQQVSNDIWTLKELTLATMGLEWPSFNWPAQPIHRRVMTVTWGLEHGLWKSGKGGRTSTIFRESCLILHCGAVGIGQPAGDELPAPTPWRHSLVVWRECLSSPDSTYRHMKCIDVRNKIISTWAEHRFGWVRAHHLLANGTRLQS